MRYHFPIHKSRINNDLKKKFRKPKLVLKKSCNLKDFHKPVKLLLEIHFYYSTVCHPK